MIVLEWGKYSMWAYLGEECVCIYNRGGKLNYQPTAALAAAQK